MRGFPSLLCDDGCVCMVSMFILVTRASTSITFSLVNGDRTPLCQCFSVPLLLVVEQAVVVCWEEVW